MVSTERVIVAHPLVDDLLAAYEPALGRDAAAYRGHVYRVLNLTVALLQEQRASDSLALAAACHDLGIWSASTFDYLDPSLHLAERWVATNALAVDLPQVRRMILLHHKLTRCAPADGPEAESFRRADLTDVGYGLVRHGIPRAFLRELRATFPNAGFQRCLGRVAIRWMLRHPTRPLPMLRW